VNQVVESRQDNEPERASITKMSYVRKKSGGDWYQLLKDRYSPVVQELRVGLNDIPEYIREAWNIILGRDKW
jgi:hypothetical protein